MFTVGLTSGCIALDVFAEIVFSFICNLLQWMTIVTESIPT
jgi:hypothetical protein